MRGQLRSVSGVLAALVPGRRVPRPELRQPRDQRRGAYCTRRPWSGTWPAPPLRLSSVDKRLPLRGWLQRGRRSQTLSRRPSRLGVRITCRSAGGAVPGPPPHGVRRSSVPASSDSDAEASCEGFEAPPARTGTWEGSGPDIAVEPMSLARRPSCRRCRALPARRRSISSGRAGARRAPSGALARSPAAGTCRPDHARWSLPEWASTTGRTRSATSPRSAAGARLPANRIVAHALFHVKQSTTVSDSRLIYERRADRFSRPTFSA